MWAKVEAKIIKSHKSNEGHYMTVYETKNNGLITIIEGIGGPEGFKQIGFDLYKKI